MPFGRSLTFPALLAILHLYIGTRIVPDLPGDTVWIVVASVVLAFSYLAMLLSLYSRALWPRPRADRIAIPGLFMAGLSSSLLVLTLLRDCVLLPAGWLLTGPRFEALRFSSAVGVVAFAALGTIIGFLGARRRPRVVRIDVPIRDLPEALNGFSIAQVSDVHVGPTIRRPYVDRIVDAVNSLTPDLIALTGDFVDGPVQELAAHTAPLARLRSRHGAFFVTGNHEYYAGVHGWLREFSRLGLRVLLNDHAVVSHDGVPVVVAGVTDFSAHHFDPSHRSDPTAALAGLSRKTGPRILLAHQPRSASAAAAAGFDLQLSGHTHGGQFWPWNWFVPLQQPFTAGLHRLGDLLVYVSRGAGYWGIPNRLGAPSEIAHLRLVPALPGPIPDSPATRSAVEGRLAGGGQAQGGRDISALAR